MREPSDDHVTDVNLVLIGITTSKENLTRAVAAFDTWVSSVPGKVYTLVILNNFFKAPTAKIENVRVKHSSDTI